MKIIFLFHALLVGGSRIKSVILFIIDVLQLASLIKDISALNMLLQILCLKNHETSTQSIPLCICNLAEKWHLSGARSQKNGTIILNLINETVSQTPSLYLKYRTSCQEAYIFVKFEHTFWRIRDISMSNQSLPVRTLLEGRPVRSHYIRTVYEVTVKRAVCDVFSSCGSLMI